VTGIARKTSGAMAITLSAPAPVGTVPGSTPAAFVPTTVGVESFACAPLPGAPPLVGACTGTTSGDALQNATVTVRFPRTSGVVDVTGIVSGPGPSQNPAPAVVQVVPGGPFGVPPIPPPIVLPPPLPPVVPLLPPTGPAWPSAWITIPGTVPLSPNEPQQTLPGSAGASATTATPTPVATPLPLGASTMDALPNADPGP
jgi:hypothetical protein